LRVQIVNTGGMRTWLGVPMLKDGVVTGCIVVYRKEVRPSTSGRSRSCRPSPTSRDRHRECAALERDEGSLEQQTAISEILRVISSSPADVKPVLNAVAERALDLCDAAESGIFMIDGDVQRFATGVGTMLIPQENQSFPLNRRLVAGRAAIDGETIHLADIVPLLDSE
jgi:hypothetical protein